MTVKIKCEKIELVDIDSIKVNPKNNNIHPQDQLDLLEKIILYQGFRMPLTISNRTTLLNCGEARLIIAKKLGMKKVPVMFQDFDNEAQEYAHMTADNELQRQSILNFQQTKDDILDFGPDFNTDYLGIKNFDIDWVSDIEAIDKIEENLDGIDGKIKVTCPMDIKDDVLIFLKAKFLETSFEGIHIE